MALRRFGACHKKLSQYLSFTIASMSSQVSIRLLPSSRCLFDEAVLIKVRGLAPEQRVDLTAKLTDDKGVLFKSSAAYRADLSGEIDLGSAPALGGSYTGVEPMGLFCSLKPETPHAKLRKTDVLSPCFVDIEVRSSENREQVLARETNERGFMIEGMRRVPVEDGRVRGILFLPPGPGPFPGVVDMYTLGGGLSEIRACLLAKQGFAILSLAYYRYKDLPKLPNKFDLEYFEEAIMFLRRQPEVRESGLGILSISKSGDLALSMASFLPGVSATVCINACCANTMLPLHYKTMVIPPLNTDLTSVKVTESGLLDVREVLVDPLAEENRGSLIPIERANCRFLFAVSGEDRNWKSDYFAEQAIKRLKDHGKESWEMVSYPEAGHFLDVPYMPHCGSCMHAAVGRVVVFGGDPCAHSKAQVDLWERIMCFFRKHLESGTSSQKAKL
ncbi:acyl-coenzyme A thioesterase 1-like [Megalops cyprinoides]|uniref:acyl-coenzyme A thioesterase 1-like n=1 Tax=Megalops cyprinoides TaxID=118141 RepID=UPI0018643E6C|nr:acyl-coenzyme A thioesterase 1-like [Megalops cyprinoides]